MKRAACRLALGLVIGSAAALPAMACLVVVKQDRTFSEHRRQTQADLDRATAIVDGEVVRPFIAGKQTALVYAYHVLKGPAGPWFEVGADDSCTIRLERIGERARFILSAGPATYLLYHDQADAWMQDYILRSDRRRIWPYREGQSSR